MMETTREITFLTYNVWSREDMVVRLRMEAIGELVRRHKPDVIFFQVTFRKKETISYVHCFHGGSHSLGL
jgi:hypothetical protein